MGEFKDEDRSIVRAFLDAIFLRRNAGTFEDDTAKTAIEKVIADTTMGSRSKAFEYMRSVIRGQGS
jgi:hypothetical protein